MSMEKTTCTKSILLIIYIDIFILNKTELSNSYSWLKPAMKILIALRFNYHKSLMTIVISSKAT